MLSLHQNNRFGYFPHIYLNWAKSDANQSAFSRRRICMEILAFKSVRGKSDKKNNVSVFWSGMRPFSSVEFWLCMFKTHNTGGFFLTIIPVCVLLVTVGSSITPPSGDSAPLWQWWTLLLWRIAAIVPGDIPASHLGLRSPATPLHYIPHYYLSITKSRVTWRPHFSRFTRLK